VTGSIQSIAAVAEENSASTEEVSASAEEMSAQVEEMTAQAADLASTAEQLWALVARFMLDADETGVEREDETVVRRRRTDDWAGTSEGTLEAGPTFSETTTGRPNVA
jgi:prophage tail gpP-like protein